MVPEDTVIVVDTCGVVPADVGAKATPRISVPGAAVSSSVNVSPVGRVVAASVSVMPSRYVGSVSATVSLVV